MGECLGGSKEVEAFSWGVVVAICGVSDEGVIDGVEVGFARQSAPQASDGIFDAAFLPGRPDIAEEGLDAGLLCELMM